VVGGWGGSGGSRSPWEQTMKTRLEARSHLTPFPAQHVELNAVQPTLSGYLPVRQKGGENAWNLHAFA